jgi:hypothetical protein
MTDLNTAKINSLTQDIQQLRVRLDGIRTEMDAFGSLVRKIEGRLSVLEDAENYRQQDENVECALASTPANSLVERVATQILNDFLYEKESDQIARSAIREVAAWINDENNGIPSWTFLQLQKELEN